MDEIKIGAEIVFNITGNHNIGYAKGEKYIGTVLSEDHRSRLYVRTIGMPRACIDERDVEWVIDPDGDFDMDEAIPNPVARELYKLMGWFEIDKILISFTYGVVRYIGTWGGGRTDKVLEVERLYSSEECFKKGDSIPKRKISIYDAFRSLYGFFPIDDYVWEYKNGRAVKGELEYFDVEIDNKGKIYCKETYYRTCEDVYKFNDLTVVDKNGDMKLVKSSKSKLMLTNDQLDVVERMKGIIDDMVRLKMIMYIDQDYGIVR